jgi:nucleoside-diphosphate-sugar epimerase
VGRAVITVREPEQPGDVRTTGGAIDRARQILHWEPVVQLEEGIKRQVAYQLGGNHT